MATPKKNPAPANPWPARLKAIRARERLTQGQAAARLGVPARTWISWENAQRTPSGAAARLIDLTFPEPA